MLLLLLTAVLLDPPKLAGLGHSGAARGAPHNFEVEVHAGTVLDSIIVPVFVVGWRETRRESLQVADLAWIQIG